MMSGAPYPTPSGHPYPTPSGLGDKDDGAGPQTGREAAAKAALTSAEVRAQALDLITKAGADGLTADEVAEKLGLDELSVRPRISEMKKKKLIGPNGERRKSSMDSTAAVMVAAAFLEPAEAESGGPEQGTLL